MDKTIDMAREAWEQSGEGWVHPDWFEDRAKALKAFEALVRADERNSWPAEMEAMERQVNILTDALAAEREACLSVIKPNATPMEIAAAIRARKSI
jgi:hypothetical protein